MGRALAAAAACLPLLACHLGPRLADFGPARAPEGVHVEASLSAPTASGATLTRGELLELRDGGLLLLVAQPPGAGKRVVLAPFDRVLWARFAGMGTSCELRGRQPPTVAVRDRLRHVSRFPQGLTSELLQRLLDAHGQAEIESLGR